MTRKIAQPLKSSHNTLAVLQARYGSRYRWFLLFSIMLGTMAAIMSSTIVNVAIPDMSGHFQLGQSRAQWVSSGFMVTMMIAMLTTPTLLMRFGFRNTYLFSMLVLLLGGIIGGFANDYEVVLLGRLIEGAAAGIVQPIPVTIIMQHFRGHDQGRANSWFGMGVVLAPAIGPSIGGVLVDVLGWRSIFFMIVPFCLASIAMAMRFVPIDKLQIPVSEHAAGATVQRTRQAQTDWWGLALVSVATVALLNGLVDLNLGRHVLASGLIASSVLFALAFVWWERQALQLGYTPLIHLHLFKYRQFVMASWVALIYGTALFGSTYLIPVYLKLGMLYTSSHAGLILLPAGLVLAITLGLAGKLNHKLPMHVWVCAGLGLLALSFFLNAQLPYASPILVLLIIACIGRIGLGCILISLQIGGLRGLAPDLIASGASAFNFIRLLGGAIGVNVCGILLEWRMTTVAANASASAALQPFAEVFILLAVLCVLALIPAWQVREKAVR